MAPANSRGQSTIEVLALLLVLTAIFVKVLDFAPQAQNIFSHNQLSKDKR